MKKQKKTTPRVGQTNKKKNDSNVTTVALGAGAGVVTVVGASAGAMMLNAENVDEIIDDVVALVNVDDDQAGDVIADHSVAHTGGATVRVIGGGGTANGVGKQQLDELTNNDQIDSDTGVELTPVGWREITDIEGNHVRVMVFQDSHGHEVAMAESEPGSGVYDLYMDPTTGVVVDDMFAAAAYTAGDFNEMLHDDGGYLAPDSNVHYAVNSDIRQDIINTDGGELIAVVDRPNAAMGSETPHPNVMVAGIDNDEIDIDAVLDVEDSEQVVALLGEDGDINDNYVQVVSEAQVLGEAQVVSEAQGAIIIDENVEASLDNDDHAQVVVQDDSHIHHASHSDVHESAMPEPIEAVPEVDPALDMHSFDSHSIDAGGGDNGADFAAIDPVAQ